MIDAEEDPKEHNPRISRNFDAGTNEDKLPWE